MRDAGTEPAAAVLPDRVSAALGDFGRRVRARFGARVAGLVLFGSYARGDWGPDSDVDVLVLVHDLSERERREVFELAEDVYFDGQVHVSPLAMSVDELETVRRREYLIAAEIDRDGRPL